MRLKIALLLLFVITGCSVVKSSAPEESLTPEEVRAAWERSMAPTEEHKIIERLAGDWTASVKFWVKPGMKPNISVARSKNKLILNGKFLIEDYNGSFAGRPFQGMSIMGFDTITKSFTNYWIDNMGTGSIYSEGGFDKEKNVITLRGAVSDPISGRRKPTYSTITLLPEGGHMLEMYDLLPDGTQFKTLEINYTPRVVE